MNHQTWDPERYGSNARFVSDLGMPVVELLAPRPGERILDLGCGDGALTEKLVALGCAVVGVDGSAEQVAARAPAASTRASWTARRSTSRGEFDAVFSNAALHWMKRPDAVIAGVWRALRPGGRFVGESAAHGCVATIVAALLARARAGAASTRGASTRGTSRPPTTTARASTPRGFARRLDRADPAPDAAARRRHRLARDLRRELHRGAARRPSGRRSSTRCARRCARRCATPTGTGPPTTSACASPRTLRGDAA